MVVLSCDCWGWFPKMFEIREFSWNWVDALLTGAFIYRKLLIDCWLINAVAAVNCDTIDPESVDELGCSTWPLDRRWTEWVDADCC